MEDIREDLAARQAVELIASEATPIPIEQAQAREKLWTPESEEKQGEGAAEPAAARLWTPTVRDASLALAPPLGNVLKESGQ